MDLHAHPLRLARRRERFTLRQLGTVTGLNFRRLHAIECGSRPSQIEARLLSEFPSRKRSMSANADEWLPSYMERVHVPTVRDVNRLHELSKRHRKTYETQYADVRNLHVAHTGLVDADARSVMFQKTRIHDFEKLIVFLNRFHDALWNMYYNGSRPPCDRWRILSGVWSRRNSKT